VLSPGRLGRSIIAAAIALSSGAFLPTTVAADSVPPVVAWQSPAAGVTAIVAPGMTTVRWTEQDPGGSGIASRTLDTLTIPANAGQCAMGPGATVTSTPQPLAAAITVGDGTCTRLTITLATVDGGSTQASSGFLLASSAPLGATATFTTLPIGTNSVWPSPLAHPVTWTETAPQAGSIAKRSVMVEGAVADANGGCANPAWAQLSVSATPSPLMLDGLAGRVCRRLVIELTDDLGRTTRSVSGVVLVLPAWTGSMSLYRAGVYSEQQTWTWCVAASVQMMLNIIRNQSDHSYANQKTYMSRIRASNRYVYPVGGDPQSWTRTLNRYGPDSAYHVISAMTFAGALRAAAIRMRLTGRPVGLLVSHGGHAWVLSGFGATADPAVTSLFSVTAVRVEGPLWGRQSIGGYDMAPNTRLTVPYFARFFTRYYQTNPTFRTIWDGRYVIIAP
jgi:hypothetical protein